MSRIDIVIVNWNAGDQLRDCIASIVAAPDSDLVARIVVVDNGSTDGSADGLEATSSLVQVDRRAENLGFAAACNAGARRGSAEFVLFLNPDTRLLHHALRRPVGFMDDDLDGRVGVVGVQLVGSDDSVQRSCARFPSVGSMVGRSLALDRLVPRVVPPHYLVDWDHCDDRDVDEVMGAFFFVRRDLFEELRGFDERFFVYYEELDFCLRARQAGSATRYLASARVFHRGGGTTEKVKAFRLYLSVRSRLAYGRKHFGQPGALAVTAAATVAEPFTRCAWSAMRGRFSEIPDTLRGYRMLWSELLGGSPSR